MVSIRNKAKARIQPTLDLLSVTSGAYVDLKSQLNDLAGATISFSQEPTTDSDAAVLGAVSLLRPWDVPARPLRRIGGDEDGGYVMGGSDAPGWALSIGVGRDISWDAHVSSMGAAVAMFDPTVRKPPQEVIRGKFYKVGIGEERAGKYRPFQDLMALAGFPGTGEGWLKIDVEGAEWPSLDGLDPNLLKPFSQIAVELHGLGRLADPTHADQIQRVLQLLTHHHLPIHIHANNYARIVRFGSYWFPDVVEVCFLRTDLASDAVPATRLHTELDRPCDPRVADVDLRGVLTIPVAR